MKREKHARSLRVTLTAEAAYVLLNQETEGRHLGCVHVAGLEVVHTARAGRSGEVKLSAEDACITDVSYTKAFDVAHAHVTQLKGRSVH